MAVSSGASRAWATWSIAPAAVRNWPDSSSHLSDTHRAVGLSCLTLIIGHFSRDCRELRFKNTMIPLPYSHLTRLSFY